MGRPRLKRPDGRLHFKLEGRMPEHDPGWFYLVRVGDTATAYDNFDNAVIWDAAPYGAAIGWTPRCVWSLEVATEAIRQADAVMDVRGWG